MFFRRLSCPVLNYLAEELPGAAVGFQENLGWIDAIFLPEILQSLPVAEPGEEPVLFGPFRAKPEIFLRLAHAPIGLAFPEEGHNGVDRYLTLKEIPAEKK